MPACTRCNIDKREDTAFRRKTSGPAKGLALPICVQCEGEIHAANLAKELRGKGYDAEAIDPAVKQREEATAADAAIAVEARK
jgi:hypothetical protein